MSFDRSQDSFGTLILPVYNAEAFLAESLREIHAWLAARPERWEIVVVDDASLDGTAGILDEFLREHSEEPITRIRFLSNRGKGFAVRAGLTLARGRYAVFTDCDLAYPMENTARILAELEAGADAAIACRVLPSSTYLISPSFFSYLYTRHLSGRAFNLLCRWLTVPRLLDTQAGLKGFRTAAVRPLVSRLVLDGFSFDVELLRALLDRGARIAEVPVSFRYDSEPTTMRFMADSLSMLRDLVRIRFRSHLGRYLDDGAPSAATRIVVHADDFGLAPGVNQAIEEGLTSGILTSASILLGSNHSTEALRWAAAHPELDFGVHLNLTFGRPVQPPETIPSLVLPSGEFLPLGRFIARFLSGRVRSKEVLAEWRSQIAAVRSAGVGISHLDSHQHLHLVPRLFSQVMEPLARDEGLAVRAMDGPICTHGSWPDPKGLVLRLATRVCLRGKGKTPVRAHGTGTALMRHPTLTVLRTLLSRMEPGHAYELVVHPGTMDPELLASGDGYLGGRESERRLLASDEFQAVLRGAGLQVMDFQKVGPRLDRGSPQPVS